MQNDSESNVYNLINQKPYIASVLWDVDDIKEVLSEKGFTTTDENVAIVCRTGIVEALEDRLGGWDIIGWFVSDVRDRLEKKIEKNPNAWYDIWNASCISLSYVLSFMQNIRKEAAEG